MIKNKDIFYIKMLCKISKNLTHDLRCKHAAVLVDHGKIISIGMNKTKSDPWQKKYASNNTCTYMHAEVDCLKSLRFTPSRKTTLYIARVDKNDSLAMSKPCSGCQEIINDYAIPRIVYTIDNGIQEKILEN